jgi:hypothetical protein
LLQGYAFRNDGADVFNGLLEPVAQSVRGFAKPACDRHHFSIAPSVIGHAASI